MQELQRDEHRRQELEGLFRSADGGGARAGGAEASRREGNDGVMDSIFGVSSEEMKRRMSSMSESTKLRMAQV